MVVVVYDNWERLVKATLRREELRLSGLRTPSDLSSASFSTSFSASSSSFNLSSFSLVGGADSFTYDQILRPTDHLSSSNLIKHGHSGSLFYGVLESGTRVVVKKIELLSLVNNQSSLIQELEILKKVSHSGLLVPFLGHCLENHENKFLVYKYMPNKDLSSCLFKEIVSDDNDHRNRRLPSLDWRKRWKIATGIAEALCYLHHECVPSLVHRDIQSSSILLDENFEVRLGSLSEVCTAQVQVQGGSQNGISRFFRLPRGSEQGTLGTSKITCAYDVYCCGKLFLELITGNRGISAANNSNTEDWMANLLPYIVPDNKKLILSILDPSLILDDHLLNKVWEVAFVAKACLSPKPSDRPQMPRIVTALKQNIAESFTNYGKMLVQLNVRIFSFSELKVATRNFESDTILGKGEYGTVYQGWLDVKSKSNSNGGSVVAVKKLHSTEILGFHKWKLSVNLLGRLSHPNLLKFLGYCWDKKELLLVYEFMQLGSLENLLFGRDSAVQPLPWDIRLKISIGAARGLAFLHALERQGFFGQKRKGQGFYKHFQPSNILLDGSYNAKISGFGVAYIDPPELVDGAHPYYYLRGKYVYAAPQYVPPTRSNDLYVDNDVYGFGVILMEMLTGVSAKAGRQPRFGIESRNLESIMDPRLDGKYASEAAAQIVQLALKCIQILPEDRPSMKEVVDTLERIEFTNEGPYIAS